MIQIKNAEVYSNLLSVKYHPILIEMELWILQRYSGIVVTSGYRLGDLGVHGTDPCRGKDIRGRRLMFTLNNVDIGPTSAESLCAAVNVAWKYDARRPQKMCAIFHDTGQGEHIHLQVCHKTKLR